MTDLSETFARSVQKHGANTGKLTRYPFEVQPPARRARVTVCHDMFVSGGILDRLFTGITVVRSEPSMTRHGETEYLLEGPMFDELKPGDEIPVYTAIMHADARPVEWRRR